MDWNTLLRPWTMEPPLVDEREFTKWGRPGFHAWNEHACELEFAQFVGDVVALTHANPIIETGVGQGFLTRRIMERLPDKQWLYAFESDQNWREQLLLFPSLHGILRYEPTPDAEMMADADLVVVDSNDPFRMAEICLWAAVHNPDSTLIVHDAGNGHPPYEGHFTLGMLIRTLRLDGFWLTNPRGGFCSNRNLEHVWTGVLERMVHSQ